MTTDSDGSDTAKLVDDLAKEVDAYQYNPRYTHDEWVRFQCVGFAVEMHKSTSTLDVVLAAKKIEEYIKEGKR